MIKTSFCSSLSKVGEVTAYSNRAEDNETLTNIRMINFIYTILIHNQLLNCKNKKFGVVKIEIWRCINHLCEVSTFLFLLPYLPVPFSFDLLFPPVFPCDCLSFLAPFDFDFPDLDSLDLASDAGLLLFPIDCDFKLLWDLASLLFFLTLFPLDFDCLAPFF